MTPDGRDPRRRFNGRERTALYLVADGICERCGGDLDPDFHSDHRLAWANGGATDVTNGDALCPTCNRAKGASSTSIQEDIPAAAPAPAAGAAPGAGARHQTPSTTRPGVPVLAADTKCKEISCTSSPTA